MLAALVLTLADVGTARSEDREHAGDDDHDRARRALKEGLARPLAEILALVKDRLGGDVVGVAFRRKNGRYLYAFKVITPEGRLRELHVDALTAEILKSEED